MKNRKRTIKLKYEAETAMPVSKVFFFPVLESTEMAEFLSVVEKQILFQMEGAEEMMSGGAK